jgi:hypothetical protein
LCRPTARWQIFGQRQIHRRGAIGVDFRHLCFPIAEVGSANLPANRKSRRLTLIRAANDRAQMYGFTGTIDAAICVEEGFVTVAKVWTAASIGVAEGEFVSMQIEPGQAAPGADASVGSRRLRFRGDFVTRLFADAGSEVLRRAGYFTGGIRLFGVP